MLNISNTVTAYRPTVGNSGYYSGTLGGSASNISNGYTPVPTDPTTLDTTTAASVSSTGTTGIREYGLLYSGYGSGIYNGTLKAYFDLSATDNGNGAASQASADYSLDGGTTWTTISVADSSANSPLTTTIGPAEFDVSLTNVDLSLLVIRLDTTGQRIGSTATISSASSSADMYDTVFVPTGSGASYTTGYRPNTGTYTGTTPTNPGNAYDKGTSTTIDSSTYAVCTSTSATASTQVYSGMTSATGKSGWLVVSGTAIISGGTGNITITYDTTGSTNPATSFYQVGTTNKAIWTAAGTYNFTVYAYVKNINPSNLRVKCSETGGTSITATLNLYDIVFLAIN